VCRGSVPCQGKSDLAARGDRGRPVLLRRRGSRAGCVPAVRSVARLRRMAARAGARRRSRLGRRRCRGVAHRRLGHLRSRVRGLERVPRLSLDRPALVGGAVLDQAERPGVLDLDCDRGRHGDRGLGGRLRAHRSGRREDEVTGDLGPLGRLAMEAGAGRAPAVGGSGPSTAHPMAPRGRRSCCDGRALGGAASTARARAGPARSPTWRRSARLHGRSDPWIAEGRRHTCSPHAGRANVGPCGPGPVVVRRPSTASIVTSSGRSAPPAPVRAGDARSSSAGTAPAGRSPDDSIGSRNCGISWSRRARTHGLWGSSVVTPGRSSCAAMEVRGSSAPHRASRAG